MSDGKTVGDVLALAIGSLGENMTAARATCITVSPDIQLVGASHPSSSSDSPLTGRYGSILALKTEGTLTHIAKELCAHVIGKSLDDQSLMMCSLVTVSESFYVRGVDLLIDISLFRCIMKCFVGLRS